MSCSTRARRSRSIATDDPDLLIQYFKDDATAFNAKKRGTIVEQGHRSTTAMSEVFFRLLEREGVPTHFVERLTEREMLVKRAARSSQIEIVVRNIIAGSLAKRLGREEGEALPEPILEYFYKNDALDDPMINDWHVRVLGLATPAGAGRDRRAWRCEVNAHPARVPRRARASCWST